MPPVPSSLVFTGTSPTYWPVPSEYPERQGHLDAGQWSGTVDSALDSALTGTPLAGHFDDHSTNRFHHPFVFTSPAESNSLYVADPTPSIDMWHQLESAELTRRIGMPALRLLASYRLPSADHLQQEHKVRRRTAARARPRAGRSANKACEPHRGDMSPLWVLSAAKSFSRRTQKASAHSLDAESRRNMSSTQLCNTSLCGSNADGGSFDYSSDILSLAPRAPRWKPKPLTILTREMKKVSQYLTIISELPDIELSVIGTFVTSRSSGIDISEAEGLTRAHYVFEIAQKSASGVKQLLQDLDAWLAGFACVNQRGLFNALTEELRAALVRLIEGEYLGKWTRLRRRLAVPGDRQELLRHERQRLYDDSRRSRRMRVDGLTNLVGSWLRQSHEHPIATASFQGLRLDEIGLLQNTVEGFGILMKHLEDLKPWKKRILRNGQGNPGTVGRHVTMNSIHCYSGHAVLAAEGCPSS